MKFSIISNNLTSVLNLRKDLLLDIQKKGYQIHVLAPNLNEFEKEASLLKSIGFNLHEISLARSGTNPIEDLKTILSIYSALRKIQPNAILSYTIKPIIYGTLVASFLKIPKIFTLISGLGFAFQSTNESSQLGFVKKLVYFLYKKAINCSEKVFFQNDDDRQLLLDLNILNNKTDTVTVNGSGVNLEKFKQVPLLFDESQKQVLPYFVMVARLLKDKGVFEYFYAAKALKNKYPEVIFNLVGGLDDNPASLSQAELNDWIDSGVIKYWGKISDVRPALAESNIFVLPSYREGVPRSTLEAMAMGRAIITTNAPGCKETVYDGKNGFKVTVQSVDELYEAMEKIILSPNAIVSMGQFSRKLAIEKYDVNKVNNHMIAEMRL
ncbi:glycosyltransferase family 4 protein [Acinetobacter sp. YH12117]|uniref:glycosyltransferase family 4 protein n=1 Tax=Acinetobacter sp. YH12117 TaxID=2601104 RepID=UPI0015D37EBB|nr:glycosyltransferase family 4 protein [Acinetobacter sp. YH12117]